MRIKLAGVAIVAAVCVSSVATLGDARTPPKGAIALTIATPTGKHRFNVEVARTPEQQARGLMFRARLAPDAGMVFPMTPPRVASFWMKNTLIPLDIIFIRNDGQIARIAARTTPHSLTPVESGEPVVAVLEIAGGRAAELGIAAGARVDWAR